MENQNNTQSKDGLSIFRDVSDRLSDYPVCRKYEIESFETVPPGPS